MALPRIGGLGLPLNLQGAFGSQVPTPGVAATASSSQFNVAGASNAVTLPAGCVQMLPAGTYYVEPGPVTSLQFLDPASVQWRTINATPLAGGFYVESDGGNYRLANLSGCPIGALITNAGAGYTNGVGAAATGLVITPSAGGSVWVPVVGGAINSTVTITAGGSSYSFPPLLVFSAPPPGGIQATGVCTVSAGAINSVTVTNQGAGYVTAPTITLYNDFRDTTGNGGVLTVNATLVGSGSLLAMYPSSAQNAAFAAGVGGHGTALTAVPTFTFAPASTTAATAVMNFCLTGFTVTAAGAAYGAGTFGLQTVSGLVAGAAAANTAGPISHTGLTVPRPGLITGTLSGGGIATAGSVVTDPGFGFQAVPALTVASAGTTVATTIAQAAATVGGIADTSWVQPF
jgi:hypothetical protein